LVDQVSSPIESASAEQGVGLLLAGICRAHRNLVASALDQIRVHVGQDHVLHRLAAEEGVTQSQLAEALSLNASTVTKTLLRLERDGVVERRADARDARVSRVHLTPRGRALVGPVADIWVHAEQRLVKDLSEVERALLRRLLMQVLANLT
jgi:DNA-binding MarR family transcriptional regulator